MLFQFCVWTVVSMVLKNDLLFAQMLIAQQYGSGDTIRNDTKCLS